MTTADARKDGSMRLVLVGWVMFVAVPFSLAFSPPIMKSPNRFPTSLASTKKSGSTRRSFRKSRRGKQRQSFSTGKKHEPSTRKILTDYAENRNQWVNEERLSAPINCEHFGLCPGCVVNENVGDTDIVRSAKLYFSSTAVRKRRMDLDKQQGEIVEEEADDDFYQVVVPSPITEWRTQAKLAVAPKTSSWGKDGCSFGLYARGTHDVLTIPNCKVHHPSINRAVRALAAATAKVGTASYNQNSGEGGLRYVQFQVERLTGRICLSFVWNAEFLKQTQPALSRLSKELTRVEPNLWHSMWCHCNDGIGNNIFSRNSNRWHRISGLEFVREPLPVGDKGWLYFSPTTFRQGNLDAFDILAMDVARAVPDGSSVCELYAGVGVLGLTSLAYHAQEGNTPLRWLRCSDENPANLRCFRRSVDSMSADVTYRKANTPRRKSKNDEAEVTFAELMERMASGEEIFDDEEEKEVGERARYTVASAWKALQDGQALGAEVLIVDPPRKGLETDVLIDLCKPFNSYQDYVEDKTMLTTPDHQVNWTNDVRTLIYVSCGFDALARDCERLLSSRGGWMLQSATGYVLFPGSNHVETICVFKR